jgi:hypothetical protein
MLTKFGGTDEKVYTAVIGGIGIVTNEGKPAI